MSAQTIKQWGLATLVFATLTGTAAAQPQYVNSLTIAGNAIDLVDGDSPNDNRLSLGSDLFYDRKSGFFYGLPDRGPGGGLIDYNTRIQKFSLDVNPNTGAIGNFQLVDTILLTNAGNNFNGQNPLLLSGDAGNLGLSFDPEGLTIGPNGNFFVSDEYGPSVYEFNPNGEFVRAFTPPANLLPREADADLNFVAGRPDIVDGRQDNRGYEGLALSSDGTKLYAMLQDPLVDEGLNDDGRRSQNLRIVEYDLVTGNSTAQYIYQLESLSSINARVPGMPFSATNQGRSIGISAIIPLWNNEFLVIERDNRGWGVDDPTASNPVSTKRVYRIDLTGATNVAGIGLQGSNNLPNGVVPVKKQLFLHVQAALVGAGEVLTEKLEGITFGPTLADGRYSLILATDNDFSVTQTGSGEQFDVFVNGDRTVSQQGALGSAAPEGFSLIPGFLYSFTTSIAPEPGAGSLALLGLLAFVPALRRRK